MPKLRVNAFSVSAEGFGAGPVQGRDIDLPSLGYRVKEHVSTGVAMHLVVGR